MESHLIAQRVRNRIFEYLELVAAAEVEVPSLKTSDIANLWEDSVDDMPNPVFPTPPYSRDEAEALRMFAIAWVRIAGIVITQIASS